jgi:hypothetical protein
MLGSKLSDSVLGLDIRVSIEDKLVSYWAKQSMEPTSG